MSEANNPPLRPALPAPPPVNAKVPFTWENIVYLDDRVPTAFLMELEQAIRDCRNRPGLSEPRTITIKVEVTPLVDDDEGDDEKRCRDVEVRFIVPPLGRPARKSKKHKLALVHGQDKAFFNADIPSDPRAVSLFEGTSVAAAEAVKRPRHPEVPDDAE